MSESSALSSLSSDESSSHEYGNKKAGKKKGGGKRATSKGKKDDGGGYKLRNCLKVPRATTYTAQALHDQIHSEDIDVQPEYQREVVWPETKQVKLIDSVFRNFYIPPIIFAVQTNEDGLEKRVCIDGKQRLTSIQRFMDGLIPHKDPHTDEKLWYIDTGASSARKKRVLPKKYQTLFANKQIVCVEYYDINDRDEREIFQRVQLGMALTPAEKLQVISSSRADFIRELLQEFLHGEEGASSSGLSSDNLDWDQSRGSDFRCVSQAVWCMEVWRGTAKGQGKDLKNAGSISLLEKWLSKDQPFEEGFVKRVREAFGTFSELVLDERWNACFKKPTKVSPIEFIVIALLVAEFRDVMEMEELSDTIAAMRDDVRTKHEDIRMNDRCAKTMFEFLRKVDVSKLKTKKGTATATKARPASKGGSKTLPVQTGSGAGPSTTTTLGKRNRASRFSSAAGGSQEDGEVDDQNQSQDQDQSQSREDGEVSSVKKARVVGGAATDTPAPAPTVAGSSGTPSKTAPPKKGEMLSRVKEMRNKIAERKAAEAAAAAAASNTGASLDRMDLDTDVKPSIATPPPTTSSSITPLPQSQPVPVAPPLGTSAGTGAGVGVGAGVSKTPTIPAQDLLQVLANSQQFKQIVGTTPTATATTTTTSTPGNVQQLPTPTPSAFSGPIKPTALLPSGHLNNTSSLPSRPPSSTSISTATGPRAPGTGSPIITGPMRPASAAPSTASGAGAPPNRYRLEFPPPPGSSSSYGEHPHQHPHQQPHQHHQQQYPHPLSQFQQQQQQGEIVPPKGYKRDGGWGARGGSANGSVYGGGGGSARGPHHQRGSGDWEYRSDGYYRSR